MSYYDEPDLYGGMLPMDYATGMTKTVVPQKYLDEVNAPQNTSASDLLAKAEDFYSKYWFILTLIQWIIIFILIFKISKN